jgi:uncharacterized protein YndB with AHSA1/START domain
MARNDIVIDAPAVSVYETLLDARSYPQFVAGAKELRGVDDDWPNPGTHFHHKVGIGPLALADNTKLLDKTPSKRVVLEVRVRPFGTGVVTFDLEPVAGRENTTHVVMTEDFNRGPLSFVFRPIREAMIRMRNAITVRRLQRLVVSGHDGRTGRA